MAIIFDHPVTLPQNEIHLWFCRDESILDKDVLKDYLSLLNEEEHERQQRFYFEKHRHQFLITRAMLRIVLSQYFADIKPQKWVFSSNSHGKPHISNLPPPFSCHFNLSHTNGMIVLAITRSHDIGVDVETISRKSDSLAIAEHFFAKQEVAALQALPLEEQQRAFIKIWTLKEAFIKAKGLGLKIPLNQFAFTINDKITIEFDPVLQEASDEWQFWQLAPDADRLVALAVKSKQAFKLELRETVPGVRVKHLLLPIAGTS